jgi:hypothetical protein
VKQQKSEEKWMSNFYRNKQGEAKNVKQNVAHKTYLEVKRKIDVKLSNFFL